MPAARRDNNVQIKNIKAREKNAKNKEHKKELKNNNKSAKKYKKEEEEAVGGANKASAKKV